MPSGLLVGEDGRAFAMQPLIAVGMVEVPMGIDQVLDRVGAEACEGLRDARTRGRNAGIHQKLAVSTGEDSDIAAGAFEHTHVAAQPVDLDRRFGCLGSNQVDEHAGLGEGFARREPAAGSGEGRPAEAAQAKTTT